MLSLLLIGLISCTKEIEFNGDLGESFIVVNGIIESDSLIRISLSKSKSAIGEQNTGSSEITSLANLTLTDNTTGETFSSNQINANGEYEFGITAKIGHSYSVAITHPDYQTATSFTSIPKAIQITDWDTSSIMIDSYMKENTINLSWQDPDGDNLYILKIFSVDTIMNTEESMYVHSSESSDIFGNDGGYSLNFNDDLFNNTLKHMSVTFPASQYYNDTNYVYEGEKSYRVVLYNISKEVYNYIISTNKAMNSEDSPFSEPVKVYTNITNGLGIFGGMSSSSVFIE